MSPARQICDVKRAAANGQGCKGSKKTPPSEGANRRHLAMGEKRRRLLPTPR
jgi:hypothetical protein